MECLWNRFSIRSLRSLLTSFGMAALLASCANSNEGAVDYRKAEAPKKAQIFPLPITDDKNKEDPVQPLRLVRKNLASWDGDAALKTNDSITINLRQARIESCFEIPNPLRGFKQNCEIAVVVRAFEFGKGNDLDFGPKAADKGRVVFYSSDVEPGQVLNFDNMPIYGPVTYEGGPIALDIFVIELDAANEQLKALLKTVAKTGSALYAPASPVLAVLDKIGSALLSGGTDDTEMRYTIVLDPQGNAHGGLNFARLEAADYAFIREDVRTAVTDWNNIRFDGNTGRLYAKNPEGGTSDYRKNTYLTLQVNKGKSTKIIDLSQNTFSNLKAELDKVDKEKAARITSTVAEISEEVIQPILVKRAQSKRFDELRGKVSALAAYPFWSGIPRCGAWV
jgi:hypothetical protein